MRQDRITLSFGWSEELQTILKERSTDHYPIRFGCNGEDYRVFTGAVNQGIDSHLEAVFLTQNGNTFTLSPESVPVLVRRLLESDDDNAQDLASGICETLGIELV